MFAGQGAQYFHMARELYEAEPAFRHWMTRVDSVVREVSGRSVTSILYDPARRKSDVFQDLSETHPALFMVQYAMARALMDRGIVPDALLGASLGTFVAAAIAGCLPLEDAVRAVVSQAAVVQRHCSGGGMIAVLADMQTFHALGLERYGELAARNFDSHFVVSAPAGAVGTIEALLSERQILFQRLPVDFAFHSRWVEEADAPLRACFEPLRWGPAAIPMACSVRGEWLRTVSPEYFWDVMRHPIEFQAVVKWLETSGPNLFVDVSPTGTMATFARKILARGSASRVLVTLSLFSEDVRAFQAAIHELGRASAAARASGKSS